MVGVCVWWEGGIDQACGFREKGFLRLQRRREWAELGFDGDMCA